ncbi:hypothetical protein GBAR_LOCUS27737, partial [Geodia barretti]
MFSRPRIPYLSVLITVHILYFIIERLYATLRAYLDLFTCSDINKVRKTSALLLEKSCDLGAGHLRGASIR